MTAGDAVRLWTTEAAFPVGGAGQALVDTLSGDMWRSGFMDNANGYDYLEIAIDADWDALADNDTLALYLARGNEAADLFAGNVPAGVAMTPANDITTSEDVLDIKKAIAAKKSYVNSISGSVKSADVFEWSQISKHWQLVIEVASGSNSIQTLNKLTYRYGYYHALQS